MKLIHFQGLNCYHGCIITLASAFGLDHTAAFSRLWSEGDLRYDPICGVFLSRRIQETLGRMGMILNTPIITRREREAAWADIPAGHYAIIGMDACLIPWCPLYQLIHGPHYFIVQKGGSETQSCFDPTYEISGQILTAAELISSAFALITVEMVRTALPLADNIHDPLYAQSREVLKTHPETLHHFLEQAEVQLQGSKDEALYPAKYVDALLTGRYLYRHFLKAQSESEKRAPLFFSQQYYNEWLACKNGFYKAALTRKSSSAFYEACILLTSLFDQELALAKNFIVYTHTA